MSEDNEKKDILERRKALGLFGLVAGAAAAGTTLMVKDPTPAPRDAAQGLVPSKPLKEVPDVVAPKGTKLKVDPDGSIRSHANTVKPHVSSKTDTPGKASSSTPPAGTSRASGSTAQPPRVSMSSKDSSSEAARRETENNRITTERTKQQAANEKKYLEAERAAQAKVDQAAKDKAAGIATQEQTDKATGDKITADEKAAYAKGKVAAGIAPNLLITASDEWHLARRASLGSNKNLVNQIEMMGYSKWIDYQLDHLNVDDTFTETMMKKIFPLSLATEDEIFHYGKDPNYFARHDMNAGYLRQCVSDRVIFESMVELWRDHLHVKQMSDKNRLSVITYDQTIRKHAMGKFKDLFFHALIHPAMLHYLDNQNSKRENPNQNLGREMLELHSLGAGNHTEADAIQTAKMLTGHSTTIVAQTRLYLWKPTYHATGTVKLSTGFTHANTSTDQSAATQALKDMVYHLSKHPKTAKRIATKLCIRFVADTPPAALVDELASIYLANDTDIKPVLRALFNHKTFKASKGTKWRRPSEVNAMMFRALGLYDMYTFDDWVQNPSAVLSPMRERMTRAGQEFQQWDTPDGFPDKADYWMAPSTMIAIWNMTEIWANQAFNQCKFTSWRQILGVTELMDAWFIVDRASEFMYGITLPPEERRAAAGYLATGDDRKTAPEWEPVTDAVLNTRLKNTMRFIFCNPRMMIR